MQRCLWKLRLFAVTAITAGVVLSAPAGPLTAGNGKGNGAGHGKSAEEILLLKKRGKNAKVEHGGEASGAVASSLRHLNGPVSASNVALERANERSTLGQARTYRDAALAEGETGAALDGKRDRLSALGTERTVEVIQAEIDALDPDLDADRIALLEQEKAGARTDAEVGAEINGVLSEIELLEATQTEQQAASDEAYEELTRGRSLTEDAVLVLRGVLGLD